MSTDEYVPSEEDAVDNYVFGRGGDDPGLSLAELRAEYGPEFDRFLAHIRRDAARKALTLYLDELIDGLEVDQLEQFRDTHYPEENPRD